MRKYENKSTPEYSKDHDDIIITFFQEYAKYRSKAGAKEIYKIRLTVSPADPIAKRKQMLDLNVIDIINEF